MRTVLAIMLGVALSFSAQASSLVGSITGRAVNAAGGAVSNQRVDLVRGGQVINVATTNAQGGWSFGNVAAGDYVVRTSVNGKLAGVRVSVAEGASVSATTIVVPTAAVAPQFGALSSLVSSLAAAGASGAAAAVTSVISETDATDLNAEEIVAIFNSLPADQQVQFAAAVVAATTSPTDANAFKPAPTAPNANTDGRTNSTTNQALFNVLTQVASVPANTPGLSPAVISIQPSSGNQPGFISGVLPTAPGGLIQPIAARIPTSVS
ncbi:MAG: carboxypeptidase-like regulatory domain-containing protein [Vicinamibacterales bacterium]